MFTSAEIIRSVESSGKKISLSALLTYITFITHRYSDDPPLDDEAEELLYIRELVASKFHEPCSSRCEEDASGRASSRQLGRVRRVDLSAPKFRMPQRRRRDDWSSLKYGDTDDRGSQERASLTEALSKVSLRDGGKATPRDRRRASASSAAECELVRARANACRIQIGPSLHIVDRELTRQDLEDMHISPEPSQARTRANTATYALRHDIAGSSKSADNEAEISRASRTVRARLDPLREEKLTDGLMDISADASSKSERHGDSVAERDDERIESSRYQAQKCIHKKERSQERNQEKRDAEETRTLGRLVPPMNQAAANYALTADSGTADEKSKRNQTEVSVRGDTGSRYAEDGGGTSNTRSDIDKQASRLLDNGRAADEIREENQGDRSKLPPSAPDTILRKTGFPRRGNITSCRCTKRARNARAIDECFSNIHDDSQSEQTDEPCDVAGENARCRSFIARYPCDLEAEGDLREIELYQPRFDDLDSILLSNEERLERVSRVTENFVELLSRPEFVKYKSDDGKQTAPRHVNPTKKSYRESLSQTDKKFDEKEIPLATSEPIRSLIVETESRNEHLPVSESSSGMDASSEKMSAAKVETKLLTLREETDDDSKDSIEPSVYPTSEASDGRIDSSREDARRSRDEGLSNTSLNKSDITTFSHMLPALSSTRMTEAQTYSCYREEPIVQNDHHADAESRATSSDRSACRDGNCCRKRRSSHDILSRVLQSLKDTSGSAADRFVTCILQDEKQSVERKIASALKKSTVTPIMVEKLLEHLNEVSSMRDAHQMETLDILRDILINIKNEAEQDAKNMGKNDRNRNDCARDVPNSTFLTNPTTPTNETEKLISRAESPRQLRTITNTSKIEQMTKNSQGPSYRNNSFDCPANQDIAESVRLERRSEATGGSKNNNGSKVDPYSQEESLKQISDIRSDEDSDKNSRHLSAKSASVKSERNRKADDADIAVLMSGDEEDAKSERREDDARNGSLANQDAKENNMHAVVDGKMLDARLNIPTEASAAAKEITGKETRDDVAPTNGRGSVASSEISEMKEQARSDASSAESKPGRVLKGGDIIFVRSSAKEDAGSPRSNENDMNSRHPVEKIIKQDPTAVKSCSDDSSRGCASLSSAKNNGSSLKGIALSKKISFNIQEEDNSVKDTRDETAGESLTAIENGHLLKSTENDNEQQLIDATNASPESKADVHSMSNSNSSVVSTLDHNDR